MNPTLISFIAIAIAIALGIGTAVTLRVQEPASPKDKGGFQ